MPSRRLPTRSTRGWRGEAGTLPSQFFALDRLAEPPGGDIGWRAGTKRIIVWFGDAPAHDPVCAAISGLADDVTEATVIAKLMAEQISVLAISVSNPGLDEDPRPISEDYKDACGAPGGAAGQATRIANATGGQFASDIDATSIAGTIVELVEKAVSQINNVRLIAAGATAPFVIAITPPGGHGPLPADEAHTLDFRVTFTGVTPCREKEQTFNGTLDVSVDGSIAAQKRVAIKVPPCQPKYV